MRLAIRCLLLAVAAPLLVSGMAVAAEKPENPPQPVAVSLQTPSAPAQPAAASHTAEPPDACTANATTEGPALTTFSSEALPACSPPPQCWSDRDCDRICGRNNGQCIRVNSCYRECACFSSATDLPARP